MRRTKSRRAAGGFTLVEMLIVVAVIAVLAAVSIPLVGASLEKAREATDAANERAAKAAAMVEYLTEEQGTGSIIYFYRSDGTVMPEGELSVQMPAGTPGYDYGQSKAHKGSCVRVEIIEEHGTVTATTKWETVKDD